MNSCHDNLFLFDIAPYIHIGESSAFIVSIIITGVIGSFTHCIGMCGPIAMIQSSMRMMNIDSNKMRQSAKIKAVFATPYYLGKATTYVFYYIILEVFTSAFSKTPYYGFIISALLILSGCGFALFAISGNYNFPFKFLNSAGQRFFERVKKKITFTPFGIKGFMMGAVLGFIPCGFVYAIIISISSYFESIALGLITVFLFGISTIPGLFISSYIGNKFINKNKKKFRLIVRILAIFNAFLLFKFAFELLI